MPAPSLFYRFAVCLLNAGTLLVACRLLINPLHPSQLQEAVEQQPEVGSKQATTPAPSDLASGPAAPPSSSPRAGGAVVLPVAVGEADKQSVAAAAASSPAVDASLEAEQEVPEVAAAQQGQPEGLDAPPEYLAERGAAKEREGLPGAGAADEGRLRFEVGSCRACWPHQRGCTRQGWPEQCLRL